MMEINSWCILLSLDIFKEQEIFCSRLHATVFFANSLLMILPDTLVTLKSPLDSEMDLDLELAGFCIQCWAMRSPCMFLQFYVSSEWFLVYLWSQVNWTNLLLIWLLKLKDKHYLVVTNNNLSTQSLNSELDGKNSSHKKKVSLLCLVYSVVLITSCTGLLGWQLKFSKLVSLIHPLDFY